MKIAIVGDTHFGFQWGTERSIDSFLQAADAFDKACKAGADIILQVGDLFDTRVPKPEVISGAMKVLVKPLLCKSSGIRIHSTIDKSLMEISSRPLEGIPLVAIHGTHDRRSKGLINPVESMEQAGFLIHINRGTIVFEKDGEKLAVHGFSGVPERYAGENFRLWNPKPVQDALNIMLLHQSFTECLYSPLEPPTMNLKMLPSGFDLFVNGHIHASDEKNFPVDKFLLSGSTIVTQVTKADTERGKYIWFYDTQTKQLTKQEIDQVRKIFLEEINVTNLSALDTRKKISDYIKTLPKDTEKPLVRIKLTGILSKGIDISDIDITEYTARFLITLEKRFDDEMTIEKLRNLHQALERRVSSEDLGIRMLQEDLEGKVLFNIEEIFKLLTEGNIEKTLEVLKNDQKTDAKELEVS